MYIIALIILRTLLVFFPCSQMVMMPRFHRGVRGSIPRKGKPCSLIKNILLDKKDLGIKS